MDAKTEFTKMLKDVQASAKEFAAMGLSMSSKALEFAGASIKRAQESLKVQAEKLASDTPKADGADAPKTETTEAK
jgi:hypothetical protein